MTRTLLLVTATILARVALAQTVILPSAAASTPPRPLAWNETVFYASSTQPSDSRCQLIYDVADVPVANASWTSMRVRRSVGIAVANSAMTTTATVVMSIAPGTPSAVTTNFQSNHGTPQVTVFNGPLSLPAAPAQSTWPAPWQPPIPFSQPFQYAAAAGRSLVIDVMQTGSTGTLPWFVEETRTDFGTRTDNPGIPWTCLFSTGTCARLSNYTDAFLGASWYAGYRDLAPNAPGFGAIGFQGVGGLWGGVLPLPYDLAPLGAPGCSWNIDPVAFLPVSSDASGVARWPTLTIPADPTAAGMAFYDHALFMDPPANAFGWVTAHSSKWVIGTGLGPPGATVDATGSSASSATGNLWHARIVTVKLE